MLRRITAVILFLAVAGVAVPGHSQETEIRLSLEEAVRRALEHNLDLQIERLNPPIAHQGIDEGLGAFDPLFSTSTPLGRGERPVNSALEQLAENGLILQKTFTPANSFGGKLFTGTQYSLSLNSQLLITNNPQRLFDRSYQPVLTFSLTQPLLRDFGIAVNLVKVRQAENTEKKALFGVKAKMLSVILNVEATYWSLFYAEQHVKVAEDNLKLAEDLVERLTRSKDSGLATALDVLQAKSQVEARRGDLARARADLLKAQSQIRVLVDPTIDVTMRIQAFDGPRDTGVPSNLREKIAQALAQRPEIPQQELVIENLAQQELLAQNNTLWRLDLLGTVGFAGLGGKGVGPTIRMLPSRLEGRDTFAEAFGDYFTHKSMNWSVGIQLQIPIWNRTALAQLEETRLQRRQQGLQLSLIKNQITLDVETAFQDTTAGFAQLLAAREAVALAQEQLSARERDLAAGLATVRQVLEAQNKLLNAQDGEIQTLVNYAGARSRLDAAQAQSFDTYRLVVQP